jgi:hypothetical protein
VKTNRDAIVRIARAHHDANVCADTHPAETAPWLVEIAHLDEASILRDTRAFFADNLDPKNVQPVIDAAARFGMIERRFDARDIISSAVLNRRLT